MTLSSIATLPRATRGIAASPPLVLAGITLAIGLIALATQLWFGMLGDVSWLITVDEKWLSGQVPYVDFIEINPPASLLLYWPAVFLAHALGLRAELVVSAFGFASVGASLGLSALITRRAGLTVGPLPYAFVLIALAVLPGEAFCERDHLAAVYALPFLALCVARAERGSIDLRLAALAGVGVGLMAAIKPPYALAAIAIAPYLWRRIGIRGLIGSAEYYFAAVVGLVYVAIVPWGFPAYVSDVMRMGIDIYVPIRDSLGALLVESGGLLFMAVGLMLVLVAHEKIERPLIAVPALAALGAFGGYLIQGKGWAYQALPALMFLTIAAGFALETRSRAAFVAGLLAMAIAAFMILHIRNLAPPIGLAAFAATWLHRRLAANGSAEASSWAALLTRYGLAASIGAACGFCVSDKPMAPGIEAALTRLGPHPTVVGITEVMGFGHPMARRIGAVWVQRVPSLFITSGVRRRIDEHPGDSALARRLQPYADRDKAMLIQDIERNRPDALLVGPLNTRMHAALWADPEISAARADYRLFATNDQPDFPAELWVRKDLVGTDAGAGSAGGPPPAREP
jgi:hypothetical protein